MIKGRKERKRGRKKERKKKRFFVLNDQLRNAVFFQHVIVLILQFCNNEIQK